METHTHTHTHTHTRYTVTDPADPAVVLSGPHWSYTHTEVTGTHTEVKPKHSPCDSEGLTHILSWILTFDLHHPRIKSSSWCHWGVCVCVRVSTVTCEECVLSQQHDFNRQIQVSEIWGLNGVTAAHRRLCEGRHSSLHIHSLLWSDAYHVTIQFRSNLTEKALTLGHEMRWDSTVHDATFIHMFKFNLPQWPLASIGIYSHRSSGGKIETFQPNSAGTAWQYEFCEST